jgi:hypothetical protein
VRHRSIHVLEAHVLRLIRRNEELTAAVDRLNAAADTAIAEAAKLREEAGNTDAALDSVTAKLTAAFPAPAEQPAQ